MKKLFKYFTTLLETEKRNDALRINGYIVYVEDTDFQLTETYIYSPASRLAPEEGDEFDWISGRSLSLSIEGDDVSFSVLAEYDPIELYNYKHTEQLVPLLVDPMHISFDSYNNESGELTNVNNENLILKLKEYFITYVKSDEFEQYLHNHKQHQSMTKSEWRRQAQNDVDF